MVLNCVACLIDTEDSQTGDNCSSQGVKEQRQRQDLRGICGQVLGNL